MYRNNHPKEAHVGTSRTKLIIPSATLPAGKTHTWYWNNPNVNATYSFAATTHNVGGSAGTNLKVEISPLRFNRTVGTNKRRLEFKVKSLASATLSYEIHMSWQTPV